MKRIVAFTLVALMIWTLISPICATDTSNTEYESNSSILAIENIDSFASFDTSEEQKSAGDVMSDEDWTSNDFVNEGAVFFSCVYDYDTNSVILDGTVAHDVLVNHRDLKIDVFLVYHGQDVDNIINDPNSRPLASTAIAIKFKFVIDVDSIFKRFIKYVVVFSDSEGRRALAAEPLFPEVDAEYEYEYGDKSGFKGAEGLSANQVGLSEPGTVIIPLDLSRMFGDSKNGYLYPLNTGYIYVNKSYVLELDDQIRSISSYGGRVYLRLLLPIGSGLLPFAGGDKEGVLYDMPNVLSDSSLDYIIAFAGFLTERYDSDENGHISGFILGKCLDMPERYNYVGNVSVDSYSSLLALYLLALGNTVRYFNSDLDIVLPFSNVNDYGDHRIIDTIYKPSEIIKYVVAYLDEGLANGYSFSVMLEAGDSSVMRSGIPLADNAYITAGNIELFTDFIDGLRKHLDSVPQSVLYLWNPPADMSENYIALNYAYTYYTLLSNKSISSFVLSASENGYYSEPDRIDPIKKIYRYIDTHLGFDVTKNILDLLEADNWSQVIGVMYDGDYSLRNTYEAKLLEGVPADYTGSYVYYDFVNTTDTDHWYMVKNCSSLKSGYSPANKQALKAVMTPSLSECYSDILMSRPSEVNMVGTPFLAVSLMIDGDNLPKDALFEVTITVGGEKNSVSYTSSVISGVETVICADVIDFVTSSATEFIRITSRCITDEVASYNLWINDIKGYSNVYSTRDLVEMIDGEEMSEKQSNNKLVMLDSFTIAVIGVTLGIVTIGLGLVFALRKRDGE